MMGLDVLLERLTEAAASERWDEALSLSRQITSAHPELSLGWHMRGVAEMNATGDLGQSVACFRRALDLDPTEGETWMALGATLFRGGQREQALACMRTGVEHDPTPLACLSVVNMLIELRRYEEGLAELDSFQGRFADQDLDQELVGWVRRLRRQANEGTAKVESSEPGRSLCAHVNP